MRRREFLQTAGALPAIALAPGFARAQSGFDPRPGAWRTFEVTTRVDIAKPSGVSRAWIPLPLEDPQYQRSLSDDWSGNAARMVKLTDGKYGATMVYAEWPASEKAPALEVRSRFQTRDRAVPLGKPFNSDRLSAPEVAFNTAPTELLPTDGIVRKTALEATRGARTDIDKARKLYDWVVDNTFRDPKTRGCGVGDIRSMLESGNLGGKCADLNALFVGLARSVGLPARDVYGVRVAKSASGYRSLGAGTENVTRAQHCRAEVFLTGYGWVPVDPADVRKVVLEEKPQPTTLADPIVPPVRDKLFGAWEMNWLAYNTAHDVNLPHSAGAPIGFFMYPQAETAAGPIDSLDPDHFRYRITARELMA
jgi:transglutaminase-like putative cysteine protease